MKLFRRDKDGGPQSTVWGHWLFEIKSLASVVLLKFEDGSRDAYHTHAFNSVSWILKGRLTEHHLESGSLEDHLPSWRPVITRRETFHKVVSEGNTWVLSLRGPWAKTWVEWSGRDGRYTELTHGRVEILR
jgi:hypothetical protein